MSTLATHPSKAENYQMWREEWLTEIMHLRLNKDPQLVANALFMRSWCDNTADHAIGTYTFGHIALANKAGIRGDDTKKLKTVSTALKVLKDLGYVKVNRKGKPGLHAEIQMVMPER